MSPKPTIHVFLTRLAVTPHTRLHNAQQTTYRTHQVGTAVQIDPPMKQSRDGGAGKGQKKRNKIPKTEEKVSFR